MSKFPKSRSVVVLMPVLLGVNNEGKVDAAFTPDLQEAQEALGVGGGFQDAAAAMRNLKRCRRSNAFVDSLVAFLDSRLKDYNNDV